MKTVFVVNPRAGMQNLDKTVVPMIEQWFQGKDLDYEVKLTEYPRHATEIAQAYGKTGKPVRLCACGGDGTLCEIAIGAVGFDNIELAVYPCGSGNDFIKCFGDKEPFLDLGSVVNGAAIPVDILTVDDTYCINLASVGIDADITAGIEKYRRFKFLRGTMPYNLSMVEHVLKPMGKDLKIEIGDDIVLENNFILIALGNGMVYGGGYHATPTARVNDGVIDVVVVEKMPLPRVVSFIETYKKGEHIAEGDIIESMRDKITLYKTDHVRITSQKEFVLNIDGETMTKTSLDIHIKKHALRFVLPPGVRYD